MKATTLKIQNLKCSGCSNTITSKLSNLRGLSSIEVSNENDTVSFFYENDDTLLETKALLSKLGYPIVGEHNALTTKAKSYVSCAIGRIKN